MPHYIDLNNTSAKPGVLGDKTIFRLNNVTLVSLKHSCFLQVEG